MRPRRVMSGRAAHAVLCATALVALGCDGNHAVAEPTTARSGAVVAGADCTPTPGKNIRLQEVADGLKKPVHALAPVGDPRLFIVEQGGTVRLLVDGRLKPTPFLDVSDRITDRGGEQGLLGLAFHPAYASNGRFFLQYTDAKGATVVAEHRVSDDPDRARPDGTVLLRVEQPYSNHNAGEIAFSPTDGMLYIGMGDGGAGGDPQGHGRNPHTLLGAMLRIDVDKKDPGLAYAIPPDNPYADGKQGRPEVWATGLRNPWRFSFDDDGSMYVGDVGQNAWEEIDRLPPGAAGLDLGWNVVEGDGHCYGAPRCSKEGFTRPILDYARTGFCDSVTGGFVYRGQCLPDLVGTYFYADYCDDFVRTFVPVGDRATERRDVTDQLDPKGRWIKNVSSFGRDGAGELYVVMHRDGRVFRIVAGGA